jgi:hypothetical protein
MSEFTPDLTDLDVPSEPTEAPDVAPPDPPYTPPAEDLGADLPPAPDLPPDPEPPAVDLDVPPHQQPQDQAPAPPLPGTTDDGTIDLPPEPPGPVDPTGSVVPDGQPGGPAESLAEGPAEGPGPVDLGGDLPPHEQPQADVGAPPAPGASDGDTIELPDPPAGAVDAPGSVMAPGQPGGEATEMPPADGPGPVVLGGDLPPHEQPQVNDGAPPAPGTTDDGPIELPGPDLPVPGAPGTEVGGLQGGAQVALPTIADPNVATPVPEEILASRGIETGPGDDLIAQIDTGGGTINGDVIILGKDANAVFPVKVERVDGDNVVVRDTRNAQASAIPRAEFRRMWSEADNRTVSGTDLAKLAEFVTPLPAPAAITPTEPIAAEDAGGGVPTGLVVAAAVGLPLVVGGGYLAARRIRG